MPSFQEFADRLERIAGGANAAARKSMDMHGATRQQMGDLVQKYAHLSGLIEGLKVRGGSGGCGSSQIGRPDMLTIEEIPGRRIPYDLTVQIGIPDNQRSPLTGTYTLSMDGPFVAVARYATFISSYNFQVTDSVSGNVERYAGRSWGRQRPISSVLDLMDAVGGWVDGTTESLSGDCDQATMEPALVSRPVSRSPFRTMQTDMYIQLKNAVYPRQNQQVPSSLWAPGFNQMLQLPVLDYFEKGDIVEFEVEPMHINNPNAGNIQALLGSMPYLNGQYDGHEGIMYPAWACEDDVADIIQRRPQGILVVGLLGFKILQPPGVRMR